MLHSNPTAYSLFPKDVEHDLPPQRPGSSQSMEQTVYVKMVEAEHKRARSDPPMSSRRSSLARLRRTISTPIGRQPQSTQERHFSVKETKSKKTHETIRAPIKLVYQPGTLQVPSQTGDAIRSSPTPTSHGGKGPALLPPPPPPPGQHVARPLSTLEEEVAELEANPVAAFLPAIKPNDCRPHIPNAIESTQRAHAVAPAPLKLRAPIKEGATPLPPLTLNIPAKEQRLVPVPAANSSPPTKPLVPVASTSPPTKPPPHPRAKKHVRFALTAPEIITPASTRAVARDRAQNSRGKQHPSWSAVFLLSAPSTENDSNSRPSTSPDPQPTPHQHANTKSILRRSNSSQNMREAVEDPDSDVEIKPLEDHVYFVINAAMEKNLKRLPRSKDRQQPRKNNPLPALPVFAEIPPTPTYKPEPNVQSSPHQDDNDQPTQYARHVPMHVQHRPISPPSPPLPLTSRKFRHPVVVNHPPSPPSSCCSRDGSPDSSRSRSASSDSEQDEMMFKMYAPEPLQISRITANSTKAGKKEERVGRPERVSWRAVA